MCFGGDVGVYAHGDNVRELELMVDWGMTPAAALVAATSGNASYFRQGERIGRVKPGLFADLIAVEGDPVRRHQGPSPREARDEGREDLQGVAMRRHRRLRSSLSRRRVTLSAAEHGPDKGTLVIVGGNMQDPAIVKRFIDLAGGPDGADRDHSDRGRSDDEYDQYWSGLKLWRENGAKNLTVLHTRDRKVADTEAFVKPIRAARGVFFGGGRQWRLADSYLNTLTHKELTALLNRGGVIGGSSAGASILTSFMVRGDTKSNEKMIGDHTVGLGFLKNAAVDQHLLRRNRQFDMLEVIDKHPELLGIGLDENTAIVVAGRSVRRDRQELRGGLQQQAGGGSERPLLFHGRGRSLRHEGAEGDAAGERMASAAGRAAARS